MDKNRGLWRGKHICNKTWVNGFPVEVRADEGVKIFIIANAKWEADDNSIDFLETDAFEVNPSTLGECTGLRDKKGKIIFEGDIAKIDKATIRGFESKYGIVEWLSDGAVFALVFGHQWLFFDEHIFLDDCEVVGNIHDNPELLKGAENNGSRS